METASRQRLAQPYMLLTVGVGAVVCLLSAYRLSVAQLDIRFVVLAILTVGIGSRLGVKIPRTKGEITVSDSLIFLTMLLFDGEVAVLLAGAEAFSTSLRFTKKKLYMVFNAAVMASSTFLTVQTLRLTFGPIGALA